MIFAQIRYKYQIISKLYKKPAPYKPSVLSYICIKNKFFKKHFAIHKLYLPLHHQKEKQLFNLSLQVKDQIFRISESKYIARKRQRVFHSLV
jgi:hypothetical protein